MSAVLTEPLYHTELIDGREIQKPLPKNLHAFVQTYLLQWFGRQLPRPYRVVSELNVICGSDRLVPDVVIASRTARYIDGNLADPAILAIEIMSPGQTLSDLLDRCERLLAAGTSRCWIIWPDRRKAWTYTSEELLCEASDVLIAALPDTASQSESDQLHISLSEIWAELPE